MTWPLTITQAERLLIQALHIDAQLRGSRPGWAHSSLASLLLAHGRLHTPARWPSNATPPGTLGSCYIDSIAQAQADALVYVEGVAWDVAFAVEHAWCATVEGIVRDPTWHSPGLAYLGIPVRATAAARIMGQQLGPLLYSAPGHASALAMQWARHGIPDGLLLDVGRPVELPPSLRRG